MKVRDRSTGEIKYATYESYRNKMVYHIGDFNGIMKPISDKNFDKYYEIITFDSVEGIIYKEK